MESIFFIGANNPETARMMNAVSRTQSVRFQGFIDNDPAKKGGTFCGLPIFGGFEALPTLDQSWKFVNLITRDAHTRFVTTREVVVSGFSLGSFIHPDIDLTLTNVGHGAYLQEAVVVQADVSIGYNCSVHMGALIGHETVVGNHTFIAHGVVISGCVKVGSGCFIGAGATILPRIKIGTGSVIGAGAVVTRDIPDWSIAVGNPARVVRAVQPFELDEV